MKKYIVFCLILISFVVKAQEKDKFLPQGNEKFADKNYADAEADYRLSQASSKRNLLLPII